MKKISIAALILCCAGLIIFIASLNLPRFSAYVIGAATESRVTVGEATLARKGTNLSVTLGDITFEGNIEGTIKQCRVVLNIMKGIYFSEILVSDFDVIVKAAGGKGHPFPYPAEQIDIRNGTVTVSGLKFIISDISARNLNTSGALTFEGHLQNGEYIGTVDIRGEGTFNERSTDVKGEIGFTAVNLAKIDTILKGAVNGRGTFSLKEDKFIFAGKVEAERFEMNDTWLRRPVQLDKVGADVFLSAFGKAVDIKIENALYKETSFTLNIRLDDYQYTSLELTSGFLNVMDVTSYATSEYSLQNLWDALKGGQVRAKMLRDIHKGPITVDLEVKDVAAVYEDMTFNGMNGQIYIDGSKVDISGLNGAYKTSRFYDVNGVIPYEDKKPVRVKGKYTANLKELPPFVDLKGVTFTEGTTEGAAEVEAGPDNELKVTGTGKINNARAEWKNTFFTAQGSYRFSRDDIVFDPLMIGKDDTDITIRGKLAEEDFDFSVKGTLGPQHLNPFFKLPFNMAGTVVLDAEIHRRGGMLSAGGDVNMDDLTFEIPGFMKKEKGIRSKAQAKLSGKGPDVTIDDLSYDLEGIHIEARGTVKDSKKINAEISLDVRDVEKVARVFFLPEETTSGDASLKLTIRDLEFPVVKLPHMTGNVRIRNGYIHIPGLPNTLGRIELTADFKGTSFDVHLNRLVCGQSTVRSGVLTVRGLETPEFSLSIDMERFNLADFTGNGKKGFGIPVIPRESIFARMKGEVSLKAKETVLGNITGQNLEANGSMTDRKITVSRLAMNMFDGAADLRGAIDLSGRIARLSASGKLAKMKSDLIFTALGGKTKDITGTAFVNGNLTSEGSTLPGLIGNLDGAMTLYTQDGVIKKWNLLSKIFGALNVYDLFRGKIDFGQDGLGYSKLGATFAGNKGIFHTENFLLDSSSMVLTGEGVIDLNKSEINGTIHVSPLIVLDRTISQIPVLRDIVKEPGQGFLYLSYSVKGHMDDPDISPDVISTIGGKTVEILRNILTLPKGVFE